MLGQVVWFQDFPLKTSKEETKSEITSGLEFKADIVQYFEDITPAGVKKLGWDTYTRGSIDFDEYDFENTHVPIKFIPSVHGIHTGDQMKKQGIG